MTRSSPVSEPYLALSQLDEIECEAEGWPDWMHSDITHPDDRRSTAVSLTKEDLEWMRNRMEEVEERSKHWPRWMQQAAGLGEFAPKPRPRNQRPRLRVIEGGAGKEKDE